MGESVSLGELIVLAGALLGAAAGVRALFRWLSGSGSSSTGQYFQRGLELGKQRKWRESISEFDKAIDENPKHVDAWAQRGYTYGELGESKQAIADIEHALSLCSNPENIAELEDAIKELRAEGG